MFSFSNFSLLIVAARRNITRLFERLFHIKHNAVDYCARKKWQSVSAEKMKIKRREKASVAREKFSKWFSGRDEEERRRFAFCTIFAQKHSGAFIWIKKASRFILFSFPPIFAGLRACSRFIIYTNPKYHLHLSIALNTASIRAFQGEIHGGGAHQNIPNDSICGLSTVVRLDSLEFNWVGTGKRAEGETREIHVCICPCTYVRVGFLLGRGAEKVMDPQQRA